MTGHEHTPPLVDPPPTPPQQQHGIERPDHPYHRLHHDPVSQQPHPGETGYVAYARDLARALCAAADGTRWQAEATSPAYPSRQLDQHSQLRITIDGTRQVVLTQATPAGGGPEQWTLAVDGQPIPHRAFPGEAPHHAEPVARSLWRHLHGVSLDPCDRLLCQQPATVATWGASTCVSHAATRPPPPRPNPAAAPPAAPIARLGRGGPPHRQPKGMGR
jgi:hypothetical protein